MMEQFDTIPLEVHLTNRQDSTLRQVAEELNKATPGGCQVTFGDKPSTKAKSAQPDHVNNAPPASWHPVRKLSDTISRVVDFFLHTSAQGPSGYFPNCPPYLSIVLTGRNDGYSNGNFAARMQNFITAFAHYADRYKLCAEFVIVEWDPPLDKPGLFDVIEWPAKGLFGGARSVFVPHDVSLEPFTDENIAHHVPPHQFKPFKDYGPILAEYVAKNVGARRARGEFVLMANGDTMLDEHIVEFISKRQLEKDFFYRSERLDIRDVIPEEMYRNSTSSSSSSSSSKAKLLSDVDQMMTWARARSDRSGCEWLDPKTAPRHCYPMQPEGSIGYCGLHLCNSGDFLLVSSEAFDRAGGYIESPYMMHGDSMGLFKLWALPQALWQVRLEWFTYHQQHGAGQGMSRPIIEWPFVMAEGSRMICRGSQVFSKLDWGMLTKKFEEKRFKL